MEGTLSDGRILARIAGMPQLQSARGLTPSFSAGPQTICIPGSHLQEISEHFRRMCSFDQGNLECFRILKKSVMDVLHPYCEFLEVFEALRDNAIHGILHLEEAETATWVQVQRLQSIGERVEPLEYNRVFPGGIDKKDSAS